MKATAIACGLIAAALILGGGGSPNPGSELLLQILAAVFVLAWLWLAETAAAPSRSELAFVGLILAVPLLQLIPLPPALWTALGWQEDRLSALALVGQDGSWRPWSLSPARTLAGLTSLFAPIAVFLITASLNRSGRDAMIMTVAAIALVGALLGALQLSLGPAAPHFYGQTHASLVGFQANRNAEADVLLIGLVAAVAAFAPSISRQAYSGKALLGDPRAAAATLLGLCAVFVLATVLTGSRMGIALISVAVVASYVILAPALRSGTRWRWMIPAFAAFVLVASILFLTVQGNTALGGVAERFAMTDDFRRELWRDGWFAIVRSWPFGIGLSGVQPALIAAERLEVLDLTLPNRVHNDYLEFVLEAGLLAIAVGFAVACLLAARAIGAWREKLVERRHIVVGGAIIGIIALHSLVDYPLRSMALACLGGMGAGLLFASRSDEERIGASPERLSRETRI